MKNKLTIRLLLIAALALGGLFALDRFAEKPQPEEEKRLLVIDGITVTFDDLKPYTDFYASFRPDSGKKTMAMRALLDHVLPMRMAQRAFPKERAEQYELARGLSDIAGSVLELEEHSKLMTMKQHKRMARMQAKLPVAMYLFDHMNTGKVSEPLEVPTGWFVVASYDLEDSPLLVGDTVDALQIGFLTHEFSDWDAWRKAEQARIGDKATFIHPDYRDSMPRWIQPPKKQP